MRDQPTPEQTPERIAEIRGQLRNAQDGPWYVETPRPGHEHEARIYTSNGQWGVAKPTNSNPIRRAADAEFIAHAREDVPFLLAQLDALTATLAHLTQQLEERER